MHYAARPEGFCCARVRGACKPLVVLRATDDATSTSSSRAMQHGPAASSSELITSKSNPSSRVRQPKNPRSFASMDAAREALQAEGKGKVSIAGFLNFISDAGHGRGDSGGGGLGAVYRGVLRWADSIAGRDLHTPRRASESGALQWSELSAQDQHAVVTLAGLLAVSPAAIQKAAAKYPSFLSQDSGDVVGRIVTLKQLLPTCDVAYLILQQPQFFLQGTCENMERHIQVRVMHLRQGLKGADVDAMITQDPMLLSLDVGEGIRRLRELWPEEDVDEEALSNSDAVELALAVRAFCDKTPQVY